MRGEARAGTCGAQRICVLVVTQKSGFTGFRWALSSDHADTARVRHNLSLACAAFPELGAPGTGYSEFKTYLDAD